MRVVIVGAAGQLGTELMHAFADTAPVGLTHDRFELESGDAIDAMLAEHRPDLVINTAAFHNVDRCEAEPERAFAVNAIAVERLAAACHREQVALAHVSTDYVFDGTQRTPYRETDDARPINVYGISKLAGEQLVRRRAARSYVFRTSGLYAARGTSAKGIPFIERMLAQAAANTPMRVVDDIWFAPSYAGDVARAIRSVVEREAYGLYHVTNSGVCSWHAFASEILRQAGYANAIEATHVSAQVNGVRRPQYSALAGAAIAELGLPEMPTWQEGIGAYLRARTIGQD